MFLTWISTLVYVSLETEYRDLGTGGWFGMWSREQGWQQRKIGIEEKPFQVHDWFTLLSHGDSILLESIRK